MPDLGKTLKQEITRLARREAKALAGPVFRQVRELKLTVRDQRRRIESLESQIARKQDRVGDGRIQPVLTGDEEPDVRISPDSIRKHRERLGLSQREVGLLLNVSPLTVSHWETGKSAPRGPNRLAIWGMRRIGVREAQERLEKIEKG